MRRIFTFSFIAIAMSLASFNLFAQCGGIVENFDNTGGTTGGFTGTTPAGGSFGLNSNQLRFTVPNVTNGTFTLRTRTFSLLSGASTIDYGFALTAGNTASVSGTTVAVRYVNTSGTITISPATSVTGGSVTSNNTTNICSTVATPSDMSTTNRSFQLIFTFTASGNGNPNSFFTIDDYRTSSSFAAAALPVKFQSLEATPSNNAVSIKWMVATEESLSGYNVEKSFDGRNFSKIGFVNAANQSVYTFTDAKSSGTVYYRIKSIDIDGKYAFSTIALVKAGQSLIVLNAYPSPFVNSFSLDHGTAAAGSLITISAEDGRTIKTLTPAVGSQRTAIDLSAAKAGMYLVRFKNSNGQVETLKILKQL